MPTSTSARMAPLTSRNEEIANQRMNTLLYEQTAQLTRWSRVAKKVILTVCNFQDDDLQEEVTSEDLSMVLDYLTMMKSSITMYQSLNEALRNRVDELLEIIRQDGQDLGTMVDHFQTMPTANIVNGIGDYETNNNGQPTPSNQSLESYRLILERAINNEEQVVAVSDELQDEQGKELEIQPQPQIQRTSWIERGLSFLLCTCVTTAVAKNRFMKFNRRRSQNC
eukprot:g7386.t1